MLNEFNCNYYASGRFAIRDLIDFQNITKVLLPEYVCESIINCFDSVNIITYKLDNNLNINIDDVLSKMTDDVTCIFIIHYFGAIHQDDKLQQISVCAKSKKIIIIEDTTHSIFSDPNTIGDYCICSLRKWFPIPDGAVLYSNKIYSLPKQKNEEIDISKVLSAMKLKDYYIENGIDNKDLFRALIKEYENDLNQYTNSYKISRYSYSLLQVFDIIEIKTQRLNNYTHLKKYFLEKRIEPIVNIENGMYPFCFPIYVNKRNSLQRYLSENGIYCAVHWPSIKNNPSRNIISEKLAKHQLSLPIDQRYNIEDMEYILTKIDDHIEFIC